jgi:hypothetical protein
MATASSGAAPAVKCTVRVLWFDVHVNDADGVERLQRGSPLRKRRFE